MISGNGTGIGINGASHDTLIAGNLIGTDATGDAALANVYGIGIGGYDNTVGGSTASARNVISGNTNAGLNISGATAANNLVMGNFIGTDLNGTAAVANGTGVLIQGGATTTSSAPTATARAMPPRRTSSRAMTTMVSSSTAPATNNVVAGNFIGTDATGTIALANGGNGVLIQGGAQSNLIGTDGDGSGDAAERNVISGNVGNGVQITGTGTSNNVVAGNFIGTDSTGTQRLANGSDGVILDTGSSGNTIGGTVAGAGNVISGNGQRSTYSGGIVIAGSGTSSNLVAGNDIGTDASGTSALGNGYDGVALDSGASGNTIGGTVAAGRQRHLRQRRQRRRISTSRRATSWRQLHRHRRYRHTAPWATATPASSSDATSSGNTIGGTAAGARNVISGQHRPRAWNRHRRRRQPGGRQLHRHRCRPGHRPVANGSDGVILDTGSTGNTIGGTAAGAGNVISGKPATASRSRQRRRPTTWLRATSSAPTPPARRAVPMAATAF